VKLVVDMNLPPAWVPVLEAAGHTAVHWSAVGDPRATDTVVMGWARANGCVVFTHDLDFGALLAITAQVGPSVIQMRTNDVTPDAQAGNLLAALQRFAGPLADGALISLDEARARVRVLPIK
jgi:predicted nuclease of predicted toxin-antitoxin system